MKIFLTLLLLATLVFLGGCAAPSSGPSGKQDGSPVFPGREASVGTFGATSR